MRTLSLPEQARALADILCMMQCKAGHDHDAIKHPTMWVTLQSCGVQTVPAETVDGVTYPAEHTEIRYCACGSTLGVAVDEHGKRI